VFFHIHAIVVRHSRIPFICQASCVAGMVALFANRLTWIVYLTFLMAAHEEKNNEGDDVQQQSIHAAILLRCCATCHHVALKVK